MFAVSGAVCLSSELNRELLNGSAKGKRRVPFPCGVPCAAAAFWWAAKACPEPVEGGKRWLPQKGRTATKPLSYMPCSML